MYALHTNSAPACANGRHRPGQQAVTASADSDIAAVTTARPACCRYWAGRSLREGAHVFVGAYRRLGSTSTGWPSPPRMSWVLTIDSDGLARTLEQA